MTTYNITGRVVTTDSSGTVTGIDDATLTIVGPNGFNSLSYSIEAAPPAGVEGVPDVEITPNVPWYAATVDGVSVIDDRFNEFPTIFQLDGPNDSTTFILALFDTITGQQYAFELGGTPVLADVTLENFPTLSSDDWTYGAVQSGAFAPGVAIPVADIAWTSTSPDDTFVGTPEAEELLGAAGNDNIGGLAGNDTIYGGPDNDTLNGGEGADLLGGGPGNDSLRGGVGNDELWSAAGDDTVLGEGGDDTLGGALGNDDMDGGDGADELWGAAGNDTLQGGAGNDTLGGSTGDDSLLGGDGLDELWGSVGNDTLAGGGDNDTLGGAVGNDSIDGGTGNDELWGADGNDTMQGGDGDDLVGAGRDDDLVLGGAGNDEVSGGAGDDTINAGADNDTVFAGGGDDVIEGGAGDDNIFGGSGADRFVFDAGHGNDTVAGFNAADGDIIDFAGTGLTFADLTITDSGTGTQITSSLGNIFLSGVSATSVTSSMFNFEGDKVVTTDSGNTDKVETTSSGGDFGILSNDGGDLIGMQNFRAGGTFSEYTGGGYTVVVIDTGIDLNHSAFGPDANNDGVSDRIVYHEDFSTDRDGTADDVQGHGTNVSSIIGSSDSRFLGIAPDVNIVALQALSNTGSGRNTDIERALQWVVANAEAYNIVAVNMSLGPGDNVNVQAPHYSMGDEFAALNQMGVITTVATGNDYYQYQTSGMSSIAADPNVIAVGALWSRDFGQTFNWGSGAKDFTTAPGRITSFSQRSDDIDMVFAPGAMITGARPGDGFSAMGGTSQATPMVAGMAALAQQMADDLLGRRLTPDEFHELLISSGVSMFDGDDEDDNVANISGTLERVDMGAVGRTIELMAANTPTPDDFAADATTTGTLAVNGTATGNIETGADSDWFRMTLTEGDTYALSLRGSPTSEGTLSDTVMTLLNANGDVIAVNDDIAGSRNSALEYTAQSTGTFYLQASSFSTLTGTYTAGLTRTGTSINDDFSGDISTTGTVTVNGPAATGTLEVTGDLDWFAVTMVAGTTYTIDLEGSGSDPLSDPFLRVYDAAGNQLRFNDDANGTLNSQLEFNAETSGTFYISAGGFANAHDGQYSVTVSSPDTGGTDVPDDASTTVTLDVNSTYDGTLDIIGDRDWVRTTLEAGAVYDLMLTGSGTSPVGDTYLRVLDAFGTEIAFDDDAGEGLNSRIESLSVNDGGTYYISAGSFADAYTGGYQIALTELSGGSTDLPTDITTTSSVMVNGSVSSDLGFVGDRDWHEATLVEGHSYRIALNGDASDTELPDPMLRVYGTDTSGTYLLGTNDDANGTLDSELVFTAGNSGSFYLSAGSFGDYGVGNYTLSLTDLGTADDYGSDSATTGVIDPNGSVVGEVNSAGDRDWFAIDVQAGAVYDFLLQGEPSQGGTLTDATLHVRDQFGTSLAYDDDGGTGRDSEMTYTSQTSGRVYLDAGGFASSVGTYTLTSILVSGGSDDYPDDLSSAFFVGIGDTRTGEIEELGDTDVMAVWLTAGQTYDISVMAAGSNTGTLSDSTMTLYDRTGTQVAYNDDGGDGRDSLVSEFTATLTGTHYIAVNAYANHYTGTYTVGVDQVDTGDDHGDTVADATMATVGGTYVGTLEENGDRDVFAVDMAVNDTFQFVLRGSTSSGGSLPDPYLRLLNDAGTELLSNDDGAGGRDAVLSGIINVADTYYIEVSGFNDAQLGTWTLETYFV